MALALFLLVQLACHAPDSARGWAPVAAAEETFGESRDGEPEDSSDCDPPLLRADGPVTCVVGPTTRFAGPRPGASHYPAQRYLQLHVLLI